MLAGITHATMSSLQRFMGLDENSALVAKYGALDEEELARRKKISNTEVPNIGLINDNSKSQE